MGEDCFISFFFFSTLHPIFGSCSQGRHAQLIPPEGGTSSYDNPIQTFQTGTGLETKPKVYIAAHSNVLVYSVFFFAGILPQYTPQLPILQCAYGWGGGECCTVRADVVKEKQLARALVS